MVEVVVVSTWCWVGERRRGIVVLEPIGVLWLGTPDGVALWHEEVGVGVQGLGEKLLVSTPSLVG